jgi:hypothetical protein
MTTGAKVAIGCAAVVVLVGIAAVIGVVGLGFWAKSKVDDVVGNQKQIEDLKSQANAHPFTEPSDGRLSEDRLVKFLEVRKRIFTVYDAHRADFEALKDKKEADLGDITRGLGILNAARLAQAQGLAEVGMSESEYAFHVGSIYTSAIAAEVHESTGGRTVSEVTDEALQKAAQALEEVAQATPPPGLTAEQAQQWQEAQEATRRQQEELMKGSEEAREAAQKADVPEVNIELYRKYEADIKKYAMGGLELIGL